VSRDIMNKQLLLLRVLEQKDRLTLSAIAVNILDRCACSTGAVSIPDSGWPGRLPTPTSRWQVQENHYLQG
jgi:hypothetical protein